MKTRKKEDHVTKELFQKEIGRLDTKIDNIARSLLTTQGDVEYLKRESATKADIRLILDRIDHFSKKIDVYSKKAIVHDYRLNQLEPKVDEHHQRLVALEAR